MAVRGILAEIASFSTKYEPEIVFVDKKPRDSQNIRIRSFLIHIESLTSCDNAFCASWGRA